MPSNTERIRRALLITPGRRDEDIASALRVGRRQVAEARAAMIAEGLIPDRRARRAWLPPPVLPVAILPVLLAYHLGALLPHGVAWWQGECVAPPAVAGPAQPWLSGVEGEPQTCTVVATGYGDVWIEGEQVRWTVYLPGVMR